MADAFYILDPSLKDFRGHHFTLTDIASRSAESAGMKVVWLTAASATDSISRSGVEVRPWFSMSMYDAYMPVRRPGLLQRAAEKFMRAAGKRTQVKSHPDPLLSLQNDLLRAMKEFARQDGETRFFAHTTDGATYRAVAALADEIAATPNLKLHLCTPYDPVGIMPNRGDGDAVNESVAKLKAAGLLGRQIFLYAENPYLAEHLSIVWRAPVSTLEIPIDMTLSTSIEKERGALRRRIGAADGAFLVASLGPARLEKGFEKFPEIIRRCREEMQRRDASGSPRQSIHFVLQASPQIIGRDAAIQKSIEAIEEKCGDMASLLKEPLSQAAYAGLLHLCDAILFPYDADKYRQRGSGAVIEALAAGKIIIATEGSYPARMIAPGAGETARTPQEFAAALCKIAAAPESYRIAARKAADDYKRRNPLEGYVRKILNAEKAGD